MLKIEQLYSDYKIRYITEGTKHCRAGWVQVPCPFCTGGDGYHLGYNTEVGYYNCWRCGGHSEVKVLRALLRLTRGQVKELISQYKGRGVRGAKTKNKGGSAKVVRLPFGTGQMTKIHRNYLRERRFDPDTLEDVWGLRGTGPVGRYKMRIIAPVTIGGELVSYQGRDITGKSPLKYKACALEKEVVHHKNTVYGVDQCRLSSFACIVEGITDAWRIGPGAVATFGIKYKTEQVMELHRIFKDTSRVFLVFDADRQAQIQSRKLQASLSMVFHKVEAISVPTDPGDLSEAEARALRREMQKKIYSVGV